MAIIISVPVSHMYKFPSHSSEHIDEVLYGEEVEIIDTIEDFVKIKNDSGYLGWIQKSDTAQQHSKPNMMINLPFADLLPDAKNYYSPILTLPLGALVDVGFSHEKEFERYGFVLLPDKRIFYIRKSALANIPKKSENNDEMREKIVSNAKKYLNVQYRWGGKTPFGIDCSGLAFMSYRLSGAKIWRDADFEKNECLSSIKLEKAQKGDLLFFKGHMAIYLNNGEFIHSSSALGRVGYGSFAENSWYGENLLKVGTIFDE